MTRYLFHFFILTLSAPLFSNIEFITEVEDNKKTFTFAGYIQNPFELLVLTDVTLRFSLYQTVSATLDTPAQDVLVYTQDIALPNTIPSNDKGAFSFTTKFPKKQGYTFYDVNYAKYKTYRLVQSPSWTLTNLARVIGTKAGYNTYQTVFSNNGVIGTPWAKISLFIYGLEDNQKVLKYYKEQRQDEAVLPFQKKYFYFDIPVKTKIDNGYDLIVSGTLDASFMKGAPLVESFNIDATN